jgi:hypothetical protein
MEASSGDEFFDVEEDVDKSAMPVIKMEPSLSPVLEKISNLSIEDDPPFSVPSSPGISDLDVQVHADGQDETAPRLSQYQKPFGGAHPLAALALDSKAPPSDSVSEFGGGSTAGSQISLGAMSVALSQLSEGGQQRPRKIRVKTKKKSKSEFSRMMMIQELSTGIKDTGQAPLFTAKFSSDGNYLAVAGEDGVIRVWKLIIEDTMTMMAEDPGYKPPRMAAIFQQEPIQVLVGHEGAILDLSWSKNNFLLSASMDRTVRVWHFSRPDSLGVFRHPDFVTSVAFHPRDDRVFITGSLDCRLRLWSIADKAVRAWNELPANNFVTAVSFNSSGKLVLAGTATGVCLIFETDVSPVFADSAHHLGI